MIDNKEIMDARKWIEFGKMFNNMIQEGWEVVLDSEFGETGTVYSVNMFTPKEEFYDSEQYITPYEAIKVMYFKYFLGESDTVETQLDLGTDCIEVLCEIADKDGITVDEVIVNILKQLLGEIPKKEDKECGCGCGCDMSESGQYNFGRVDLPKPKPKAEVKTRKIVCNDCSHFVRFIDIDSPVCVYHRAETTDYYPACKSFIAKSK
jgi:hypothetical protein